jgi:hypothetical protein
MRGTETGKLAVRRCLGRAGVKGQTVMRACIKSKMRLKCRRLYCKHHSHILNQESKLRPEPISGSRLITNDCGNPGSHQSAPLGSKSCFSRPFLMLFGLTPVICRALLRAADPHAVRIRGSNAYLAGRRSLCLPVFAKAPDCEPLPECRWAPTASARGARTFRAPLRAGF